MKEEQKHIIKYSVYILVWIGLIILTCLTVSVASLDLAKIGAIIALTIATVKAILVLSYFMHLKYESSAFKIMFLITAATAIIIIAFIFLDIPLR